MADNKCKVVEEEEVLNDDDVKATNLHYDEIDKSFADVSFSVKLQKVDRAIGNFVNRAVNATMNIADLGRQGTLNEAKVKKYLDKAFATEEKQKKEQALIVTKIMSNIRMNPDFKALAEDIIFDVTAKMNFDELRALGRPVDIDPFTKLPNLYQLPMEELRIIYNYLAPAFDVDKDGNARGLMKGNIAFEFALPKSVLRSAVSKKVMEFKEQIYKFPMYLNRAMSTYNGPIDVPSHLEAQLTHPDTDIPQVDGIRRNKAGLKDIYDNLMTTMQAFLKGQGMIHEDIHLHQLVTDIMLGKAFIRTDEEGFGKVYSFVNEVPVGVYESSGDTKFQWKGKKFDKKVLEKLREENPEFSMTDYVVPYQITYEKNTKFGETETVTLPQVDFGMNKIKTGTSTMLIATAFDSTLQHIDTILEEVGLDNQNSLNNLQQQYDSIVKRFKKDKIDFPETLFGEIQNELETFKDQQKLIEDAIYERNQNRLKNKVQNISERYALEDGTIIKGNFVKRYYPRMYYNHNLGEAITGALENIDNEISLLKIAILPTDSPTAQEAKLRNTRIERLSSLLKAKSNLQQALSRYTEQDGSAYKDDDIPDAIRPYEKHFKSVSGYIPYKYVRKDSSVVFDMIARTKRNIVRGETLMKMLEAYADVDDAGYRNYLVNQYRKAFGSINAEGSFLGMRFSMKDLSRLTGGKVNDRSMRKFVLGMKSLHTFSSLGGWLTGPLNMAAMVNKFMEVGYDSTLTGFIDMQLEENQALIVQSGILSFEDVVETHVIQYGNPEEQKSFNKLKKKYEKAINSKDPDVTQAEKNLAKGLLKIIEKNNSKWTQVTRSMANWVITGKLRSVPGESPSRSIGKFLLNLRQYVSMSLTEKLVRGTSFMIGVNHAIASGAATDKSDPIAIKWGQEMVNQLDFTLGAEGVGDMFGNDIMQWFHHIRVWSTQRMSYGYHAYKRMYLANYGYTPKDFSGTQNIKAGYGFLKALLTQAMGSGAKVAGPAIGALYGATAIAGAPAATVGTLATVGGALGYLTVKGIHSLTNIRERNKAMRIANPNKAKGAQMLLMHGFTSALYDLILFNIDMDWAKLGATAQGVKTLKNFMFKSNVNKVGPALTSPLLRATFMSTYMLYKALSDEEEVETHDWVKLFGSAAGLGAMFVAYSLLDIFFDSNGMRNRKYHTQLDWGKQAFNISPLNIRSLPGFVNTENIYKSAQFTKKYYDAFGIDILPGPIVPPTSMPKKIK